VTTAAGHRVDQAPLHGRIQQGLTSGDGSQRRGDLGGGGVLGQVAPGTRVQCNEDRLVVGEGGQHHHLHLGMLGTDPPGSRHPVAAGHPQVH
jgi:hypothetical protein